MTKAVRMQIDIYMDYVTIANQVVHRPTHIARSAWMRFWEIVKLNELD